MGNIPVALVSGAVTAGLIATGYLDGGERENVKIKLCAASASNPLIGGQRDTENSISIVPASAAYFNVGASVAGNIAASVAGHVVVSADGTLTVSGIVSVQGSHPVSAQGHVAVS